MPAKLLIDKLIKNDLPESTRPINEWLLLTNIRELHPALCLIDEVMSEK